MFGSIGRFAAAIIGSIVLTGCATAAPIAGDASTAKLDESQPIEEQDFLRNFQQYLSFDAIRPVYDPEFSDADRAPYADQELVIGISLAGEAKAYSISVLRVREMVNDELAGIPILVTW